MLLAGSSFLVFQLHWFTEPAPRWSWSGSSLGKKVPTVKIETTEREREREKSERIMWMIIPGQQPGEEETVVAFEVTEVSANQREGRRKG